MKLSLGAFAAVLLTSASASASAPDAFEVKKRNLRPKTTDSVSAAVEPTDGKDHDRALMQHNNFGPLSCNVDVSAAPCSTDLSALIADTVASAEVVVPCGQCVNVDITSGETLTLPSGLDIQGKLRFPPTSNVTLRLPHVYNQGVLQIEAPDAGNEVKFLLFGTADEYLMPHVDNVHACDGTAGCKVGKKAFVTAGGTLDIRALDDPACPSWGRLLNLRSTSAPVSTSGPFDVIDVGTVAASCFKVGDEILVTSPSFDMERRTLATVSSVDPAAGELTLTAPAVDIPYEACAASNEDFAVEVARLTRSVVITAEEDDATNDGLHGGHFIVLHTPNVQQHIEGVEFRGLGQQGNLGRYSLHFHMCQDVSGSVVTKNVIRESNQRGIVIHGTDSVLVHDNVGFEISGHGFFTEDGIERNVTFSSNLAASMRNARFQIDHPKDGPESDDSVSAFWITVTEDNHWIGNVAAGSEDRGFWLDTRTFFRGSLMFNNKKNIGTFKDNTAHSSKLFGIMWYSPGWGPEELNVVENCRAYRNGHQGQFIHNNQNILFKGGLMADNHWGATRTLDNVKNVTLQNYHIMGLTDNYAAVYQKLHDTDACHPGRPFNTMYFHARDTLFPDLRLGITLEDSTFTHGTNCPAPALQMEGAHNQWDLPTFNRIKNVTFPDGWPSDQPLFSQCKTSTTDLSNHFSADGTPPLQVMDGSSSPSGVPGFYVLDVPAMTAFSKCQPIEEGACAVFCEGDCYRRVKIQTNFAASTSNFQMVITSNKGEFAIEDTGIEKNHIGMYIFSLPSTITTFDITFQDSETGAQGWPDWIEVDFGEEPPCGSSPNPSMVNAIAPPRTDERCDELIEGGDFEGGTFDSWLGHVNTHLEAVTPGRGGSAYALRASNRLNMGSDNPYVYIDTSCLEVGQYYEFWADVQLRNNAGVSQACTDNCPYVQLGIDTWDADTRERDFEWNPGYLGSVISGETDGWFVLTGSVVITQAVVDGSRVRVQFGGASNNVDIVIDNISLTLTTPPEPTALPTLAPTAVPTPAPTSNEETHAPTVAPQLTNLALGKPTQQRVTVHGGESSRAVDGNTNGMWWGGSVTHGGGNDWLNVDLLDTYPIHFIKIYNRLDCCKENLNSINVIIFDENYQIVTMKTLTSNSADVVEWILDTPVQGYRVQVQNSNVLHIAEIEVYGVVPPPSPTPPIPSLTNLALGKPTEQRVTVHGGESSRAVDGNTNGVWAGGSVTHGGGNDWLDVDLLDTYPIHKIMIYNRLDCCKEKLNIITVFIFDEASQIVAEKTLTSNSADVVVWELDEPVDGYLVQVRNSNVLHIAEIEVYGVVPAPSSTPPLPALTNLALGKPTQQRVTVHGGDSSRAVDGNTDGMWAGGSVTHGGGNDWLNIILLGTYPIHKIMIYNRLDCCKEKLNSIKVFIFDADDQIVSEKTLTSSSADVVVWQLGEPVDGYLVQVQNANVLHVAEIEVYGDA